jgi:hypothetical protein
MVLFYLRGLYSLFVLSLSAWVHKETRGETFSWCHHSGGVHNLLLYCHFIYFHAGTHDYVICVLSLLSKQFFSPFNAWLKDIDSETSLDVIAIVVTCSLLQECNLEEVEEEPSKSLKDSKKANGPEKTPSLVFKITNRVAYKTVLKGQYP